MSTEDIDRPNTRRGTKTTTKAAARNVSSRRAAGLPDVAPTPAKSKRRGAPKVESVGATKNAAGAKLEPSPRRGKTVAGKTTATGNASVEKSPPARQRGARNALPMAPATAKVPAARIAAAKQALAKAKAATPAPAKAHAPRKGKPATATRIVESASSVAPPPPSVLSSTAPAKPLLRVDTLPLPSPAKAAPAKAEPEQPSASPALDFEAFAGNLARMIEEGGKAMAAYLRPREEGTIKDDVAEDIADVVKTIGNVAEYWLVDPQRTVDAQSRLIGGYLSLWSSTLKRLGGEDTPPVASPAPRDGRFVDKEWTNNLFFDTLKQTYLITANWAEKMVEEAEIEKHTKHKAEFYVRQIASAVSPSNFVLTNPELLRTTLASNGENLVRGMKMLAEDIEAGGGELKIRQTDGSKFKVGVNLATTPGKVIFQNELMQLIQYSPTTPTVQSLPLVIVPPWINKYYVLDLNAEKSFVRWAVDQGLTVFIISWVNPDPSLGTKGFDAYMHDGVLKAIEVAKQAAGTDETHVMGYCVGGTMLAMTLAWLAAGGTGAIRDAGIRSASFLTTQVDFTHAGDLKVFIDEEQVSHLERKMLESGVMEGGKMARAFNMLRANDLIWPYVVNNYLKGQAPFPFDILYWNSDSTRLPAANHSFYLRNCYLDNRFATGRLKLDGRKLDLSQVSLPIYSLATREDHIAPAQSVFLGMQKFGVSSRFVLAGSGHIAGVVNPPARGKYQYWTGDAPEGKLDDWIAGAQMHPGSWWPDWYAWIEAQDGKLVPARTPGEGAFPAIEDAPGSYVKVNS